MAKKEPNLLGLAPLSQNANGVVIYGAAANAGGTPNQAQQQIVTEAQKHVVVMQQQRLKAEVAAHEIAQMHQTAAQEFHDTVAQLSALKEAARGKDYQSLVDEYNQRDAQLAAQHLFGTTEVSARNIGMETARPLYREDEPIVVKVVEKRGLLQRLLGA